MSSPSVSNKPIRNLPRTPAPVVNPWAVVSSLDTPPDYRDCVITVDELVSVIRAQDSTGVPEKLRGRTKTANNGAVRINFAHHSNFAGHQAEVVSVETRRVDGFADASDARPALPESIAAPPCRV
jgi:hypothetical protein